MANFKGTADIIMGRIKSGKQNYESSCKDESKAKETKSNKMKERNRVLENTKR